MRAILVERLGGPEVLTLQEIEPPQLGPTDVLVDVHVAGINFMDTGARRHGRADGVLPFVPGVEASGVVSAIGDDVGEVSVGDRVAWPYGYGTYAEQVVLPAAGTVPIPDTVDDETAAAVMMQGLTAHHFVTEAFDVRPGDVAVVHAAAGGLGRMLTQLVTHRGGTVIGVVSREDKVAVAAAAGAAHVVVSSDDAFVDRVLDLTDGDGADVVFDGNGETTFRASMRVLRRHGTLLYYGAFIGEVPSLSMRDLPNSIKISFPVFRDHIPDRAALLKHSVEVFDLIVGGALTVSIGGRYPLADARQAHIDLESRTTTGKLVLDVTGHG